MRLFEYPEKIGMWERKINAYAQQKVEFGAGATVVAEKVAEIEALARGEDCRAGRPAR